MTPEIQSVLTIIPVFLFSLCVHEYAHAWVATRLGDHTPASEGRLSMHPMAHADPVGTFILPTLCLTLGWPFFGWAKPVIVSGGQIKWGFRGMALVAAAGPLANFLLAIIITGFYGWLIRVPYEHQSLEALRTFSLVGIQLNLMLGIFNLIPLPPLDGFAVIQGFLPKRVNLKLYHLGRYKDLVLVVLLFSGGLAVVSRPVTYLTRYLIGLAQG